MLPHHMKLDVCENRPKYRQGRKYTAVKVYSVSDESRYLLLVGVPSLGITEELHALCSSHGVVSALSTVDDYPSEQFTKTYLLKYEKIGNARMAKRKLDDLEFYGGRLHVCYAPEYETVEETRWKLQERRITIARKCREIEEDKSAAAAKRRDQSPPSDANRASSNSNNRVFNNKNVDMIPRFSNAKHSLVNSYQAMPTYPSMGDNSHTYMQTRVSGSQVASVNVDNASSLSGGIHPVPSSHAGSKRTNAAVEAASWYAASFSSKEDVTTATSAKRVCAAAIGQPEVKVNKEQMIIRPASSVGSRSSKPRFVPRQLSSVMKAAAMEAHKTVVDNSSRLGKVQMASLPVDVEERIRSGSGQHVADETTLSIRSKVKQVLS